MEFRKLKKEFTSARRYLPILLGATGGFLYYYFIGCATGSCAITSNPWSSIIFGALIGTAFIKKRIRQDQPDKN